MSKDDYEEDIISYLNLAISNIIYIADYYHRDRDLVLGDFAIRLKSVSETCTFRKVKNDWRDLSDEDTK